MTEFLPGIYKVLQKTDRGNTTEINIFIIPGKKGERSLMIDAGFQDENCLAQMEGVLKELDISYEDLDVFLTHKHHDHSGLASVYAHQLLRLRPVHSSGTRPLSASHQLLGHG